ncbi:hypothetical protein [Streptomyces sp. XH2]|uniref:hypothetical protein n=1 Tax=Streptomyces sp. XH2 TaxID=3412483 RepID=UPI003C7BA711
MTDQPNLDELARMRADLSTALMTMAEQLAPLFDAADGMRAELATRGYSPESAEQVATVWLCTAMTTMGGTQ